MHNNPEWCRSRYWLCHFLHNRHERTKIAWQTAGVRDITTPQVWLDHWSQTDDHWLLNVESSRCGDDPAYLQSLRLYFKERQFHARLFARLHAQRQPTTTPSHPPTPHTTHPHTHTTPAHTHARTMRAIPTWRRPLGPRFELSVHLMRLIVLAEQCQHVIHTSHDPDMIAVGQQVRGDLAGHIAFLSERLTLEYADFNFIRRNLRRIRLRGMLLAAVAVLPPMAGSRIDTTLDAAQRFESILERVVPYHRDALLLALGQQRQRPYDQFVHLI